MLFSLFLFGSKNIIECKNTQNTRRILKYRQIHMQAHVKPHNTITNLQIATQQLQQEKLLTGKISKCAGQVDNFFFPGRRVFTTRSQRTKRFFPSRMLAISSVSKFLSDSRISLSSGWFFKKFAKSFPLKYSTRVSCRTAHLETKSLWSLTFSANTWYTSFLAACFWKQKVTKTTQTQLQNNRNNFCLSNKNGAPKKTQKQNAIKHSPKNDLIRRGNKGFQKIKD